MSFVYFLKLLFARRREQFGLLARTLLLGMFLLGGALGGMPIPPEEIEQHFQAMSQAQVVQILEREAPETEPEA